MHFVGFVTGEDVDAAMAPFDENLDVTPYREDLTLDEVGRALAFFAEYDKVPDHSPDPHEPTTFDVAAAKAGNGPSLCKIASAYHGSGVQQDADGFFRMSTCNPNGHWDWWVVGGRWRGFFLLRDDLAAKVGTSRVGQPGTGEFLALKEGAPMADYTGKADVARKDEIDWAGMRRFAELRADHTYDLWEQHFASKVTPEELAAHKTWPVMLAAAQGGSRADYDGVREAYHAQPLCKVAQAYRASTFDAYRSRPKDAPSDPDEDTLRWMSVDDCLIGREAYVKQAGDSAFTPYFIVHNGEWLARETWDSAAKEHVPFTRGSMTWEEYVVGWLESLPADTLLTVVDAHS